VPLLGVGRIVGDQLWEEDVVPLDELDLGAAGEGALDGLERRGRHADPMDSQAAERLEPGGAVAAVDGLGVGVGDARAEAHEELVGCPGGLTLSMGQGGQNEGCERDEKKPRDDPEEAWV
jgi:hypothetical protein